MPPTPLRTISLVWPGRTPGREYGELSIVDGRAWRYYAWFRNRDDEAAATFAISRLLSHHLPCEIPNEQQDIVRLVRHQLIRMSDWDALTGHVFALLIRVGVGHELEEPLTEIEIVHHRRALCRCAVAGDPLPFGSLRDKQAAKRVAKRPDPVGEIVIERHLIKAQRCLVSKQRIQFLRPCGRSSYGQTQRAPVNWKALGVIQVEPVPLEEWSEPVQRVVEEVFMVNGVELAMFDHIQGVSEFKDRDAGWLQKARKPGDKIIYVVYMSDHVVRDHDIGELAFARELFGASRPEEIVNRRHANGVCPRYRPVGRIDTEALNPSVDEVAQQVSVVTGNLNHETEGAKLVFASQRFDMFGRMLQQRGRG